MATPARPDYGIDAPHVMRNLFLAGVVCLLLLFVAPQHLRLGVVDILLRQSLIWMGSSFLLFGCFFLLYVKVGKLWHRDKLLSLHTWSGNEHVLDVGCGRGLLLAGAAKRVPHGSAVGIDIWSNVDMGGNSEAATQRNLQMESVADRCTLLSESAVEMSFPDAAFDVIVSNLCLHNIYDKAERQKALTEIVRVLKPAGVALISDYKLTGEYAAAFLAAGLDVRRQWGSFAAFPPLRIVVARKLS